MIGLRTAKKIVVLVVGVTLGLLGVVMLVTPGPGLVVILLGLAVLATEFLWARRLLDRVKRHARDAADAVLRRKK